MTIGVTGSKVAARVARGTKTQPADLWTPYRVRWDFLTRLCGSVPSDPEIVKAWLAARQPTHKPPAARSIEAINEEIFATLADGDEPIEYSHLVFQRHEGGLAMRAATIRAHLKDCARVLSAQYIGKIQGERAFSTRVINGLYLDPAAYWIPILRPDGSRVTEHDGEQDKAIHVRGPRGQQMNALKRYEWVEPARMDFALLVLGESVTASDLEHLFRYGGVHGYAGERGDGEGRYTFTLTREGASNGE